MQSREFFLVVSSLWALPWDVGADVGSLPVQAPGGCTFLRVSPSSVPAGSSETWQRPRPSEVGLFVHGHTGGRIPCQTPALRSLHLGFALLGFKKHDPIGVVNYLATTLKLGAGGTFFCLLLPAH